MDEDYLQLKSDDDLVNGLKSGAGPEFLAELWRRHQPMVLATCTRVAYNSADAEDLASTTFLQAIRNIDKYNEGNFPGWLRTMAHRLALNYIHSATVRNVRDGLESWMTDPDTSPTREEQLDRVRRIAECIKVLSEPQQIVLKLLYLEGLEYKEIAAAMGVSLTTVRGHAENGRKRFRKIWQERYGEDIG